MSFLSVLKTIGHDVAKGLTVASSVGALAAPVISMTPIGPIYNTVLNAITIAEQAIPQSGAGGVKKDAVIAMVNALHPGLNQAQLSAAVDAVVASLNAIAGAVSSAGSAPAPASAPATP